MYVVVLFVRPCLLCILGNFGYTALKHRPTHPTNTHQTQKCSTNVAAGIPVKLLSSTVKTESARVAREDAPSVTSALYF